MKKTLILIFAAATFFIAGGLSMRPAYAQLDCSRSDLTAKQQIQCGACDAAGTTDAQGNPTCNPSGSASGVGNTITTVVNLLSAIGGVAAVIVIIVSGLRYVTSAGKEEGVKNAKNGVLYAIIGLVIIALAQLIVHFVLHTTTTATSPNAQTNNSSSSPSRSSGSPSSSTGGAGNSTPSHLGGRVTQ